MKKRFLCATALVVGLGIPFALHAEPKPSSLSVSRADWDASGEQLTIQVHADRRVKQVTAIYNNQTYTLTRSNRNSDYILVLNGTCFADSAVISAPNYQETVQVTSINGSPEGHFCSEPSPPPAPQRDLVVIANNDLGMHCACPGGEYFLLLPPFNTLRAQVIERGPLPKLLGAGDNIKVKYDLMQNTDESLKADPYFSSWIESMPKYGFGDAVRPDGRIQGLTGATLDGDMRDSGDGIWEVTGVPAFPDVSANSTDAEKIMTDPLGGPNRNPYITAQVSVLDSTTGEKLAETSTVVPVAFGGCCSCHLELTQDKGLAPTTANSFALMGSLHERDSGVNFAKMDPDGDGVPGPIRCSACHLDPAMGESVAPGYPGYPTSQYTFSNVLHRWHVENPNVLQYNPNLATDCYSCHPGNNVGCFRGLHENKGLWCTDCHGDLNTRVAEGQLEQPWSGYTLPKCIQCHGDQGEGNGLLNGFGGYFLNSRGHVGSKVLCSTCHGSPHALYPSNLAADNEQPLSLQGDEAAIGRCDVCHTDKGSQWAKPPHEPAGDNAPAGGGGAGGIDAATELATTCLNCHGDRSSGVSCTNNKWTSHDGTRVTTEVYDAVIAYLTGSTCGSGGGSTGGSTGGIDAATELATTCLDCHGDRSSGISCTNSGWTSHDGTRVTTEVYDAVTAYLTGSTCSSGGGTGGSTTSGVPADHTDSAGGVMHKPGKDMPYSNGCTTCHGSDLRGGIAPSCYSCHGREWTESDSSSDSWGGSYTASN